MNNILRANQNKFPERYHEYAIKDLVWDEPSTVDTPILTNLQKDIQKNGLIYPIVVRSNEKDRPDKLFVQVGRQRVWIAKQLGYTHISAYRSPFEDTDFGNKSQWY
jgi:ParB-like chromosome segregation protein Spo0J|tara:strand:+ start:1056 stop:1373 length:318 start_codon:yes stop_codon:yes gene_type:complete